MPDPHILIVEDEEDLAENLADLLKFDGYTVDDCIYINGDFIDTEIEYMKNRSEIYKISSDDDEDHTTLSDKVKTSSDLSELEGRTVRLQFRMRGSKLYSMQFVQK